MMVGLFSKKQQNQKHSTWETEDKATRQLSSTHKLVIPNPKRSVPGPSILSSLVVQSMGTSRTGHRIHMQHGHIPPNTYLQISLNLVKRNCYAYNCHSVLFNSKKKVCSVHITGLPTFSDPNQLVLQT